MKKTVFAVLVLMSSVSAMAEKIDTRQICQDKRKEMITHAEKVIKQNMEENLRLQVQKLYQDNKFTNVENISFLNDESSGKDYYTGINYRRNFYRVNAGADSIEMKEIHYVQFKRHVVSKEDVDALGRVKSVTCTIVPTGSDSSDRIFISYVDNRDSDKRLFQFSVPLPYDAFSSAVKF